MTEIRPLNAKERLAQGFGLDVASCESCYWRLNAIAWCVLFDRRTDDDFVCECHQTDMPAELDVKLLGS